MFVDIVLGHFLSKLLCVLWPCLGMLFLFWALHHKRETSTSYFVDLLVCVWGKIKVFCLLFGGKYNSRKLNKSYFLVWNNFLSKNKQCHCRLLPKRGQQWWLKWVKFASISCFKISDHRFRLLSFLYYLLQYLESTLSILKQLRVGSNGFFDF